MLFFIAAIVVAVSISGVIIGMSNSMAQELKMKADTMSNEVRTEIKIVNDPRHVPYQDGNVTLYVKNVGDISLNYNNIAILIDGQYINDTAVISSSNDGRWTVTETVTIDARVSLAPGDHTVKVVTPNGVSDTLAFRI